MELVGLIGGERKKAIGFQFVVYMGKHSFIYSSFSSLRRSSIASVGRPSMGARAPKVML